MSSPIPSPLGDYNQVFAATPSGLQTAGGLYIAPYGTELPTDVDEPLDAAFKSLGYVSSDGVTISIDGSTTPIEVWSGESIGSLRDKFQIDYSMSLYQVLSPHVNAAIFGDGSVTTAAATSQHGNRMKVAISSRMPKIATLILDAFFEDKAIRQVAEFVQMSDIDDITLVHNEPMAFQPTFTVYRGTGGIHVTQYSDDGQKIAA
ncbi:hypothetical protein [Mycolicibacterium komossense]|uniref:Phage tail protein n=1 Tax=Mycolicibacterium komossense TaxID=1779 RepID=A0ABT3C9A8_9MYCO|nr:hypothetical protein [Mycolicibacterium komossense]MCV7226059.1 phage tail protein [Mycolicibacterium komossense]